MDRINLLLSSRVKEVTLVAPFISYVEQRKNEIEAKAHNRITVKYSSSIGLSASLVVFKKDKNNAEDSILFSKIVKKYRSLCNIDLILKYIRENLNKAISLKSLMKVSKIGNFYTLRSLLEDLIETGLVLQLHNYNKNKAGTAMYLYPYYYKGCDNLYLCIRHLLALGYEVYVDSPKSIFAVFDSKRYLIALGTNIELLNNVNNIIDKKILINDENVINFSQITNYTMAEFLTLTTFWLFLTHNIIKLYVSVSFWYILHS